jgi:alpha-N-arabinofuranosidase
MKIGICITAVITLGCSIGFAQPTAKLTVDATAPVATVSPTLYGLMTEEINYSYDGGLYAEMIRNRTFTPQTDQWRPVVDDGAKISWEQVKEGPSKALDHSLKVTIAAASASAAAGLANNGYWGMAVRPSTTYAGSFYASTQGVGPATLRLVNDNTGKVVAQAKVETTDDGWHQYRFSMTTGAQVKAGEDNHFTITFNRPGTAMLQLISLLPPTYHDRANGNRPDLMKLMAAMNPHFLRFPGGNYLEGNIIKDRFDWKSTIGPMVDRPTHQSPWGYRSTDGMGLLEFLEWCEDLKMEPLLAVYAGYSLRGEHVTGAELRLYIQDALDEIEYVTGGTDTRWGAERAKDGHPEPFPLHYIEIGNEDFFDRSGSYEQRFPAFAEAIRKKYPQYKLIATTPVKSGDPDLLDDHYYRSPEEFYGMVHKYDTADRNGPKIFVGEWATRTGSPTPDFDAALGDAAWMTGMERNSDLILMASYAPMFVNVNPGGMQWATDLMGYDASRAYGSPSYWAQVLFAEHLGDHTVKTTAESLSDRVFWSATVTGNKMLHLKLVNATDQMQRFSMEIVGAAPGTAAGRELHAGSKWETNTIDHPDQVVPQPVKVTVPSGAWSYELPANAIQVLEVPLRGR